MIVRCYKDVCEKRVLKGVVTGKCIYNINVYYFISYHSRKFYKENNLTEMY